MKRTLCLLFLSIAVMLGLSMVASAQVNGSQVTITFQSPLGTNYGGFYTGIYNGTVGSVPTSFICDDSMNDITAGESWQATVESLSNAGTTGLFSGNPYTATYAAGGTAGDSYTPQQVYNAVAYLANQIFINPTGPNVNSLAYAIWDLMDHPLSHGSSGQPADTSTYINLGLANVDYQNPDILFYVPNQTDANGPQEFISETAEPLSMALMGTFLTLAGFAIGRKKLFSHAA